MSTTRFLLSRSLGIYELTVLQNCDERIDFVMCNPPFYTSMEEIELSARQKELEPFAVSNPSSLLSRFFDDHTEDIPRL